MTPRSVLRVVRDEEPPVVQTRGLPILRTVKAPGDYVCENPALVAWRSRKEVA